MKKIALSYEMYKNCDFFTVWITTPFRTRGTVVFVPCYLKLAGTVCKIQNVTAFWLIKAAKLNAPDSPATS